MAELLEEFPQPCSHDHSPLRPWHVHGWVEVDDNGYYAGRECLMLTAHGGRPGYVAVVVPQEGLSPLLPVIPLPPDPLGSSIVEWLRCAQEAGFTHVRFELCGRGKPRSIEWPLRPLTR